MTDTRSLERIAENQATFRAANENIELAAQRLPFADGLIPFICECPLEVCTELLRLSLGDYEAIRADPRQFVVSPGHEDSAIEAGAGRVVEQTSRYSVIEKIGTAGDVAEERYDELADGDAAPA